MKRRTLNALVNCRTRSQIVSRVILTMRSVRLGFLFLTSILLASLPVAAQTPTGTAAPTGWHVTVPAEGGLIFQMKVDGKGPYRTVFDTGAVNVMSANFAQQLGLRIDEKTIDFGAIGGSVKARTVYIDTLTIGELNIKNQTFYVLDIPSDAGTPQRAIGLPGDHIHLRDGVVYLNGVAQNEPDAGMPTFDDPNPQHAYQLFPRRLSRRTSQASLEVATANHAAQWAVDLPNHIIDGDLIVPPRQSLRNGRQPHRVP